MRHMTDTSPACLSTSAFRPAPSRADAPGDALSWLEAHLCFATHASGLAFNRIYRRKLDPLGLTYPQYLVLMVLNLHPGASIGQLGARLSLDSNTLTPMLKRLEATGFLTRQRDPEDERRVLLRLTDKGRAVRDHAQDITGCVAQAIGMDPQELRRLTGEMQALRLRLEAFGRRDDGGSGP